MKKYTDVYDNIIGFLLVVVLGISLYAIAINLPQTIKDMAAAIALYW